MASKCYVICEARPECLRMAADKIRPAKDKFTDIVYMRAKPKNVGDLLLSLANDNSSLKEDDVIYIAIPLVDPPQIKNVIAALAKITQKNINYFWYYAPDWFDKDQTVDSAVSKAKLISPVPDTVSAEAACNTHYKKDQIKSIRSDIASYIDYRLMFFFMGADTAETTLKAIITALASRQENKFSFPLDEDPNMADLVKQFIEIQPSMAGRSDAFETYKKRIVDLARLDKKVIIIGKTGTGKEATAYFLHEFSPRRGKKFVAVNCACYTDDMLMSELFGHVKGSFSGATVAKKGLVEEADGGTMFLDEIPDASPLVQAKLLRFLQSGEYSPVGSNATKRVDVKIVAGAQPNRLSQLREDIIFRLEKRLYTRSLDELNTIYRTEPGNGLPDIITIARNLAASSIGTPKIGDAVEVGFKFKPSWVTHEDVVKFWSEIAKPESVELLTNHRWPGNVRDLQTFISLCLSENKKLCEAVAELKIESATATADTVNQSAPAQFAPINSKDDLIPIHELNNLYAEHIRMSGIINSRNQKALATKVGLSLNPFKYYIVDANPWTKQTKKNKSADTDDNVTVSADIKSKSK